VVVVVVWASDVDGDGDGFGEVTAATLAVVLDPDERGLPELQDTATSAKITTNAPAGTRVPRRGVMPTV
jgi:hypothetical protein